MKVQANVFYDVVNFGIEHIESAQKIKGDEKKETEKYCCQKGYNLIGSQA